MNNNLVLTPLAFLEKAAECLKVIAHPVRLRMIEMLSQGEFTVGELALESEVLPHVASDHLRLMRRCELLASRKEGQKVFYTIKDPQLLGILSCIHKKIATLGGKKNEND